MEYRTDASAERHIADATDRMLARIAQAIATDARRFAPVDTGELVGSIEAGTPSGGKVRVTAHADHAGYQELGTRHHEAQPFLSPALYRARVI